MRGARSEVVMSVSQTDNTCIPYCPECMESLEHTGDKLYYCRICCNFFIELDGRIQHYLLVRGPTRDPAAP